RPHLEMKGSPRLLHHARRNGLMGLRTQVCRATAVTLALGTLGVLAPPGNADSPKDSPPAKKDGQPAEPPKAKLGLLVNEPNACQGYTLIASSNSATTYLVDMEGRVVNSWKSDCNPGLSAYLLDNGNLLRTGQVKNPPFFGGGAGGRIQEFTWDG